ncbi:alpha/beta fold hydrolase [Cognatishimia sp. MH4019]|uniref:alpha/beta fold hydrolase n=1 Tax=Cognatishimia sp. MH4019 TaxID=2854030 RepID=UPI001CD68B4B|nr:alpha/beta hydrolase [Cognatishimia sp. MH4019]
MPNPSYLTTESGRRIAYHRSAGQGPGVVFLGGFKSDMEGSKATHLEDWCRAQNRAYLRFDYSGHGESDGAFTDGCIGDWAADAQAAIRQLTDGPQVLVGSSMGGWISLLTARAMPEKVAGLVTIAAAPDFTEDGFWANFTVDQRAALETDGQIALPSDYGEPYIITKHLIEEGRDNLVLRSPLKLPFPTRCLQGTADTSVTTETALKLLDHAQCDDIRLTLVKYKDHSFSDPECLSIIEAAITDVTQRIAM